MMKKVIADALERFLDPAVLRPQIICASVYIAAFESLKESIVARIRDFYWIGIWQSDTIQNKCCSTWLEPKGHASCIFRTRPNSRRFASGSMRSPQLKTSIAFGNNWLSWE